MLRNGTMQAICQHEKADKPRYVAERTASIFFRIKAEDRLIFDLWGHSCLIQEHIIRSCKWLEGDVRLGAWRWSPTVAPGRAWAMDEERLRTWRIKAAELRAVADNIKDPAARLAMRNAAANYDKLADDAEQHRTWKNADPAEQRRRLREEAARLSVLHYERRLAMAADLMEIATLTHKLAEARDKVRLVREQVAATEPKTEAAEYQQDAKRLRMRAEEYQVVAEATASKSARRTYLRLARNYDLLADRAEVKARKGRAG